MKIQSRPPVLSTPPTSPTPPAPAAPSETVELSRGQIFWEGAKVGLLHFGVPAVAGLVVPGHGQLAGAVAGTAVGVARAHGSQVPGALTTGVVGGMFFGAAAGGASRLGLLGALGITGLGVLAFGMAALQNDMTRR